MAEISAKKMQIGSREGCTVSMDGNGAELVVMYAAITKTLADNILDSGISVDKAEALISSTFKAGISLSKIGEKKGNKMSKKSGIAAIAVDTEELKKQLDEMQGE